ncbi:hypothetical protein ABOM_010553 [Aspergillus bombycis]|uniref:Cyanovirin-N domain-containing protein n=1 Tax=Aspergillus bombycis TaxID=109264 RepID=A0A1F7ZMZ6_9EURO|nr:hypothetical protein ABOM_010553 [Aspergillus bombycis]OGM40836.1 hypothetical protein ABOM_010553 [Aspergillus bombycis]
MYRAWIIITLILSVLVATQPTGEGSTAGEGGIRGGLRRVGSKITGSLKHAKRELYVCSKVEATVLKQWDRSRWHLVAQCPPRDVGKLTKQRPQTGGESPQENPPRRGSNPNQNPGIGVSRLPLDKCLGWNEQNGEFTWTANGNGIEKGHCSECKVEGGQPVAEEESGKGKTADKGKTPERGMSFTLTCKCDKKAGETGKADARFELVPKVKVGGNGAISCHGYKDRLHPEID